MIDEEGQLFQEVRRWEHVIYKRKRSGKEPSPEADKALADARAALKAWRAAHALLAAPKRKVDRQIPLRDINAARVAAATARGPRLGGKIV